VDVEGFERAIAGATRTCRASWKGGSKQTASPVYRDPEEDGVLKAITIRGQKGSAVLALSKRRTRRKSVNPDEEGEVVLDIRRSIADSGGQVGDIGILYDESHSSIVPK